MSTADDNDNVSIGCASEDDGAGILKCLASAFEPYRESYTPGAEDFFGMKLYEYGKTLKSDSNDG